MGVALGRLLIALTVLPGAAVAEPLRLGFAGRVTSIDPHFFVAPANVSTSMHLFDRLIHRTADSRLVPWIATCWGPVSDTAWEFKLRPGMRWHDGHVVTADDIAFTIDRVRNVPNSPGGFAGMVRTITDVEIVDPITVRLHTARPAPTLPTDLADIAIIARHVGTGATTEDYNSGKAAIGSGPYRLVAYAIGEHVELARNDSWWGPKSTWDRVQIRMIANSGARTAAMLSGDIDVMEFPPGSDLPRLRSDPRISVVSIVGLQTVLLAPDYSRTANPPFITDKAGARLPHNPLLDVRVRRALSLAINRQALATNVMEGTAEATGQWLPPGAFSYAKTVATPVADPTLARSLLAEAGYPDGFKIVLHTPNDRLPTDVATSLAVAQMWTRIGVSTQVESSPFAVFATRASRQEFFRFPHLHLIAGLHIDYLHDTARPKAQLDFFTG